MTILLSFYIGFIVLILAVAGFALFRNEWVYRNRTAINRRISADCRRLIAEQPLTLDVVQFFHDRTNEYWTYDEMMQIRHWHIWNVEKMRNTTT